jgi:nucleoside-diphosphate-sugar epimerase
MQTLILGYGFAGFYCARLWLEQGHDVSAISRHYPSAYHLDGLNHHSKDLTDYSFSSSPELILYCAPPPREGNSDTLISSVLTNLVNAHFKGHFIYWGSSGVYGNHQGDWVDENSVCHAHTALQCRRLDAEAQVQMLAERSACQVSLLRMSGLFGKERLPSLESQVVVASEAPYSNLVFIEDAARLVTDIMNHQIGLGVMNVSDGLPKKMGDLQRKVAEIKGEAMLEAPYETVFNHASSMKRQFLSASKRLSIQKLKSAFPTFQFTDFSQAVEQCLYPKLYPS